MELRDKILEEAGNLFIKNGIKVVTMDSIAQSLGISKRIIYENFKDKDDLLRNFLFGNAQSHKQRLLEIMKNAENVIEALFNFGDFSRKTFSQINPVFFDDIKKYHNDLFQSIVNSEHIRNHEISYTILKRGVNEGIFTKTIDIEITNLFIHYSLEFVQKISQQQCPDHKKIWKSVFLPYLRGICTDKGIELLNSFLKKHENLESI